MADEKVLTLTSQEKYALAAHMLTNIMPKDHEEGIKYYDAFKECDLYTSRKLLTGKDAAKISIDDLKDNDGVDLPLSTSTVNYILDILNKQMNGTLALTLVPVSVRLRAVQLGQYTKKE